MYHRGGACNGMALSWWSKLLFCSTTSDPDIPITAVWWLPVGRYGDPTIVRWDLPRGKAACPRHRNPEALSPCQPIICKQTRPWERLLSVDPGAQCVCWLLDAFLVMGAAGRRVQPSSLHLCHLGASGRQLAAEPDTLQFEKQGHSQSAAPGLLPPQIHTKHTHPLPCWCVDCQTSPDSNHHTIYARHITVCVPRYTHSCIDYHPNPEHWVSNKPPTHTYTHTHSHTCNQHFLREKSFCEPECPGLSWLAAILGLKTKHTVLYVLCASFSINCRSTGSEDWQNHRDALNIPNHKKVDLICVGTLRREGRKVLHESLSQCNDICDPKPSFIYLNVEKTQC